MSVSMICWLLLLHFIADFVLQSREMAKNKSENIKYLFAHGGVIFVIFVLGTSCMWFAILNAVIHMIIDRYIWRSYKKNVSRKTDNLAEWKYWEDHRFYTIIGFDQLLHVCVMMLLCGAMI